MYIFRDYEKIIIIFRDPILRAMSPSNQLKSNVPFKDQKLNEEYFTNSFSKDLKDTMPAWKAWYEKIYPVSQIAVNTLNYC